jgi:Leucine-rich repeat (LRR) protein
MRSRQQPRNESFFEPQGRSIQSALVAARQDGVLKLRARGLTAFPPEVWNIGSVELPQDGKWWETRELLERLDASENCLAELPDDVAALEQLVELNLSHNKLSKLPTADVWSKLLRLADLRLRHNALRALPDGFGADNSPPLVRLHIAHNALVGLPSALCEIASLEEIDASNNKLRAVPPGLSGLPSLRTLLLACNELTELNFDDSPPPVLVTLDVSQNRLNELAVNRASGLRALHASRNQLSRLNLDGCTALQELQLSHNSFLTLPPLECCPCLATIDASYNKIRYIDGESVSRMRSLLRLDLSNNSLCDVAQLAPLGRMELVTLGVQGNMLRGIPHATVAGPVSKLLAHLRAKLPEEIPLPAFAPLPAPPPRQGRGAGQSRGPEAGGSGTPGSDSLASAFAPPASQGRGAEGAGSALPGGDKLASALQKSGTCLIISGRGLREIPEGAFSLDPQLVSPSGLLTLDASHNAIACLPAHIHLLSALQHLRLDSNLLRELPDALCDCTALEILRVDQNKLSCLPSNLGRLSRLVELNCACNQIERLPPQIWSCRRLSRLICTSNKLTSGGLGLEGFTAASAPPLELLDLGENRLATCPVLGDWPGLREIHLQKNGMRDLSASVERCAQLQTLDLRDNEIGQLPPQLARCELLQALTLSGNPLRSIPYHVQEKGAAAVMALLARRLGA